jgi:TRAP-type mannitol/chloroaromatic compound transport system permease large subunit
VLIILADVLGVPVGDLFQGAIMPSVGVAMPEKIDAYTAGGLGE